jgi:hypothetical protein
MNTNTTDLIFWLDRLHPHWREGEIATKDESLVEELMIWFLTRQPSWLDDIVPACINKANGLEWFASLFDDDADCRATKQARWTAFGYCEKGIVDELLHAESLELAYG